jgi:hypothetical protein
MNEREQDWNMVEESAKLIEQWAATQPEDIQDSVQRLISAAFGEQAVKEIERMQHE